MKYLVKFFVVTFLLFIYTHASAEQKIAYLDMKFVLNNSKAGRARKIFYKRHLKKTKKIFLIWKMGSKKKKLIYYQKRMI